MWEYQLNIAEDDVNLILGHTWELLGKKYKYFFFDKNCAYRMAEIISLADGIDIIPRNNYWVLPQGILQSMNGISSHGQPLISEVIYLPSRQSKLYHHFANLSPSEKKSAHALISDFEGTNKSLSNKLIASQYKNHVDTLLDYNQYLIVKEKAELGSRYHRSYNSALKMRFALPPHPSEQDYPNEKKPHEDRRASYVAVTAKRHSDTGDALANITLRPAYYDELDYSSAHVKHAALTMGEISLDINESHVAVDHLTLVKVKAVNPSATGLPLDGGRAWLLDVGLSQFNNVCAPHCLIPRAESGIGFTRGHLIARNISRRDF
ncbi:MAG: DUF4105 domain-containing protein [Marinagarivorans sp.]|nr:DUF4105 domain-containing protein [Marinagarivorans sp.]